MMHGAWRMVDGAWCMVGDLEDMAGERRESFSTAWSAAWVAATSSSIRRLQSD